MTERGITPSQTVGPFFAYALTPRGRYPFECPIGPDLVAPGAPGAIRIELRVTDGDGAPVPDCMIEIWQADGEGRYASATTPGSNAPFAGFGRAECDGDGRCAFTTLKPGRVPGPKGAPQAPHVAVSVFARGMLNRLVTRIYFPDEPSNAEDAILALVPAERRGALVARAAGEGVYQFDIRLQGEGETPFFAV
jgi:protocatechuate 3,4-dioxygenase alpha subunit